MNTPRPAYDEKARERIRRGLLRYKEQHGIGVPTLQLRIAEAIGDTAQRIPLKSLQRFLAGTHRTDDALVAHCATFLEQAAPPPPEAGLGEMLAAFLNDEPDEEYDFGPVRGRYYSYIQTEKQGSGERVWTPYSCLTLIHAQTPHYLQAHEEVANPDRSSDLQGYGPEIFEPRKLYTPMRYSGVFVHYQWGTFLMVMRHYFHMRCALLHSSSPKGDETEYNLEGTGLEPLLGFGDLELFNLKNSYDIRYVASGNIDKAHN